MPRHARPSAKATRLGAVIVAAGTLASTALVLPADAAGSSMSSTTSVAPYVLPAAPGVDVMSLLTVGDPSKTAVNSYQMVGIPDGLGAYLRSDGQIVVNMNHELSSSAGIPRAHGQKGAFVSRLVIRPSDMSVRTGQDLNRPGVHYFDPATRRYTTAVPAGQSAAFNRFCSGTTVPAGWLFNAATGNGTMQSIHFAGEEAGSEGRAFATFGRGLTKAFPRMGLRSYENIVPARNATDTTTVIGLDDANPGTLGLYAGTKTTGTDPLIAGGFTNGVLGTIVVSGSATDAAFRTNVGTGVATPFTVTNIDWTKTGAQQRAEAIAEGGLQLNRIEDGHFDPANPNDFYFLTTEGGQGVGGGGGGGLWRMRFTDIENPNAGGTLTLVLDGSESITLAKPDNMVIDEHGNLLIQEDPGNDPVLARILAYRIADGALGTVAQFDGAQFTPGAPAFLTADEESSGIIDAESLKGVGWFLFDAQVHTSAGLPAGTGPGTVQELVERGQLLAMRVTDWSAVYGS